MYFLTFQPDYVPKLCINFNKSQPMYAYKDYACKKRLTMCSEGKEKIICKGLKFRSH